VDKKISQSVPDIDEGTIYNNLVVAESKTGKSRTFPLEGSTEVLHGILWGSLLADSCSSVMLPTLPSQLSACSLSLLFALSLLLLFLLFFLHSFYYLLFVLSFSLLLFLVVMSKTLFLLFIVVRDCFLFLLFIVFMLNREHQSCQ